MNQIPNCSLENKVARREKAHEQLRALYESSEGWPEPTFYPRIQQLFFNCLLNE